MVRQDARHCAVLLIKPESGTGIENTRYGSLPYNVWFEDAIERFCATPNEAYDALQRLLDGRDVE